MESKIRELLVKAAEKGTLNKIPKEYLTEENLLAGIDRVTGWNCFHLAASTGQLHQIPQQFLSAKNIFEKGTLNKIPKEYLTSPFYTFINFGSESESPWLNLNPRDCIPYFHEIKDITDYFRDLATISEEHDKRAKNLIKEIKFLKKLRNLPALKI